MSTYILYIFISVLVILVPNIKIKLDWHYRHHIELKLEMLSW